MRPSIVLAASALAAVASAQTTTTSGAGAASTVSQSMPAAATQGFDASKPTQVDKIAWCTSQRNNCPKICGGTARENTCDTTLLTYSCICSNGTAPDVTAFSETLPYFICEANYGQCVAAHPDDADGQATCLANRKCGTRNATEELAASSSAAATTAASGASASGTASATASASGSSSSGSAAMSVNVELATGAFAGLLLAGFGFLL